MTATAAAAIPIPIAASSGSVPTPWAAGIAARSAASADVAPNPNQHAVPAADNRAIFRRIRVPGAVSLCGCSRARPNARPLVTNARGPDRPIRSTTVNINSIPPLPYISERTANGFTPGSTRTSINIVNAYYSS
ncbi:hypothetical protein J19TS2_26230 [Cohnella xylanilytica]|nr:hypothetical protein J19TS2_26230 [Cohnella xylanilytica]